MTELSQQQHADLHQEFLDKLGRRRQLILDQWQELRSIRWTGTGLDQLRIWVQQVAGGCKAFGYQEMGERARELENRLACLPRDRKGESSELAAVSSSVERLRMQMDRVQAMDPAQRAAAIAANIPPPLVYAMDPDPHQLELLASGLRTNGFRVRTYDDVEAMLGVLDSSPPNAIVMDVGFNGGRWRGLDAMDSLKATPHAKIPVVLLSASSDMRARLRAHRLGAAAFLAKPADLEDLLLTLRLACREARRDVLRILLVSDEPAAATELDTALLAAGMVTTVLTDPMATLRTLPGARPDALVVDLHQPAFTGEELLAVLAGVAEYAALPTFCLSRDVRHKVGQRGIGPGMQRFLVKPTTAELVDALRVGVLENKRWVERFGGKAGTDSGGSGISRERLHSRLEEAVGAATEEGTCFGVVYLVLDRMMDVHGRHGIDGVMELQRSLERNVSGLVEEGDAWAPLGTGALAMVLGPRTLVGHAEFMARLGQAIAGNSVMHGREALECRASAALLPLLPGTESADELLARAEAAARASSQAEGNRCFVVQPAQAPDIEAEADDSGLPADRLALHFQPIVDDHRVEKRIYDVLVRLRQEDGSLLPARAFLPEIESSGLAPQLDRWVMRAAVAHLANSPKGKGTELAVRLSPASLESSRLLADIGKIIAGVDAASGNRLVFQIDEGWLGRNDTTGMDFAVALRDLGCGLMLCNFGSTDNPRRAAWASWLDYAKLSPQRLAEIAEAGDKRAKVEKMIRDAQVRGARVVACNVEDEPTMATLCSWGVRLFQGSLVQM